MATIEVHDWQIRPGLAPELAKLMRSTAAAWHPPANTPTYRGVRLYQSSGTRVMLTAEWDSLADAEKWYAAIGADPAGQEYFRNVNEISVYSRGARYWTLLYASTGDGLRSGETGSSVVQVNTYVVKWAQAEAMVKLAESQMAVFRPPEGTPTYNSVRAYATSSGEVVWMIEWNGQADAEKWWAAWFAQPGMGPYLEKLGQVVLPGGDDEYWTMLLEL